MQRPGEDITALTGLRGFATLWVVAYHFWEFLGFPLLLVGGVPLSPFIRNGYFSVDIFFVLSGFLVARPFIRAAQGLGRQPSYGQYLWRRVKRVIPAYWANLLVLFAVITLATGTPPLGPTSFLAHLGLLFWYTLPYGGLPFNPVWWTLPIEWWAYFVLPPLALALGRMRPWLWLLAVLVLVLWIRLEFARHYFAGEEGFWWQAPDYRFLRARFDQFAIGLFAAWYFERGLSMRQARVCGSIGLAWFAAVFLYVGWFVPRWLHDAIQPWIFVHYTALAIPIALIVLAIASGWRPLARAFELKLFMLAGSTSYSLYLWHYPVFEYVFRHATWMGDASPAVRAAVAIPLAAIATALAYVAFERPFLSTRARGTPGVTVAAPPAQA